MRSRRFGADGADREARPHETRLTPLTDVSRGAGSLQDRIWEAAASYALDGESLQTLLDDLDRVFERASLPAPDAELIRSIALAWSDSFLGLYSRITCLDPLTGLATRQHLQMHVAGLYTPELQSPRVVIVIETDHRPRPFQRIDSSGQLIHAVGLTALTAALGSELVRGELMASLSLRRCGVVAPRDERLSELVRVLDARASECLRPRGGRARVWVEGLPATAAAAATLVDELCR